MKKITLLGALLVSTAMQAQTFYWPGTRVSELTSGTQYFIYNTANDGKDRSWFLFSDGSTLKTNNTSPKDFATSENKYIFTLTKPAVMKSANHWYMKSVHGIVGVGGQTNNTETRDLYITPWFGNDKISKGSAKSEDENGLLQNPDEINTHVFAITQNDGPNLVADDNTYAWNGNDVSVAGEGSAWTRWSVAHPYAFYTVESKDVDPVAYAYYQELTARNGKLATLAFDMQKIYGLVQEGSKYYSNYKEASEGSYEGLLDGDDNTYFHSAWNNGGTDGTDPKHYLRAELSEQTTEFYFITKRRTQNNNNRPTSILVEGSNEADGEYTTITTISEGLPTAADDYFYFSSKITSETGAYKYIRFTPQTTSPEQTRFFTYSEFYVIKFTPESEATMNAVHALYDCKNHVNQTDIENGTLESSLLAAGNGIDAELNKDTYASVALQNLIDECKPFADKIGEGVNKFTADGFADALAAAEAALQSGSNVAAALENLKNVKEAMTINQPETGKFYRIKSVAKNKYVSSVPVADGRESLIDEADATTVFYLSDDNRLTNSIGVNLGSNSGPAGNSLGTTFEFQINNNGYYLIKSTERVEPLYPHYDNGDLLSYDFSGGVYADKLADAWTLEEVNDEASQPKITKQMTAQYATVAAPVALNIPADVKAYTVKVDGEVAKLTEITGGVIPAGVAAVIEKTGAGESYEFTFAPSGSTANANDLQGVYVETTIPAKNNAYVLANGTKGVGFYLLSETERVLGANKAYLSIPNDAAGVKAFVLDLGDLTGINSTEVAGEEVYYDLQGRRVLKPVKGIYVTKSGKKVFFTK